MKRQICYLGIVLNGFTMEKLFRTLMYSHVVFPPLSLDYPINYEIHNSYEGRKEVLV